jgi:choline dehydrogenase
MTSEAYDYIVVGAGSSGCVLANRLSADGRFTVLLLEAGGPDTNPWIHIPIGYGKTIFDRKINWGYETQPEPELNGRRIYWPRGKVLGGSGAVNGLIHIRGQREDFDGWAAAGNAGWSHAELLLFFKRSERHALGAGEHHGGDGPLWVSDLTERHPLCEAFIGAGRSLGLARNDDFNGATQEGVGYYQLNTRNGLRCSPAVAYLKPARGRSSLSIRTRALVRRVLFQGRKAVGVEMDGAGGLTRVEARREVILAAGAINSPQLLLLSGVGPRPQLERFGIEPVVDLPGVGLNLQDHLQARLVMKGTTSSYNDVFNSRVRTLLAGMRWAFFRKGPLTVSAGQAGAFVRVAADAARPDVQIIFITFSVDRPGEPMHPFSGFTISVCQLRPESRGSIELASGDPRVPPAIKANYLSAPGDLAVMREAVRVAREFARTSPLRDLIAAEVRPGGAVSADNDIEAFIRSDATTIFHPAGTCKMGCDSDAVVDAELRVYGVEGLRVIDASIMPTLVSGNSHAAVVAIGEKGADLVLGIASSTISGTVSC